MYTPSKTFTSQTRKNPHLNKFFLTLMEKDENQSFSEYDVLRVFRKIKRNHNVLKNKHFDVFNETSFENIEDKIEQIVKFNHVEKLKKDIL